MGNSCQFHPHSVDISPQIIIDTTNTQCYPKIIDTSLYVFSPTKPYMNNNLVQKTIEHSDDEIDEQIDECSIKEISKKKEQYSHLDSQNSHQQDSKTTILRSILKQPVSQGTLGSSYSSKRNRVRFITRRSSKYKQK